MLQNKDIAKF